MPNSDIANLSAVATVTNADEMELQVLGEVITKKCSVAQLTQVEATARAVQDDVIEAGAGLNTNGTMPSLTNAWYLRDADFAVGFTDRGGADVNVTASIVNALRALDAKIYASVVQLNSAIKSVTVYCSAADILACNAVPKILIEAPYGSVIELISVSGVAIFGTAAYESGTDGFVVRYTGGNSMFTFTNAFVETAANMAEKAIPTASTTLSIETGVELYCATAPATGDGQYYINITYSLRQTA
jgi:hypothetical protein